MGVGGFNPVLPSAAHDARVHERNVQAKEAQSVGTKESEASSGDRDADGRQAWRWNQQQQKDQGQDRKKVQDISGKTGTALDLDG